MLLCTETLTTPSGVPSSFEDSRPRATTFGLGASADLHMAPCAAPLQEAKLPEERMPPWQSLCIAMYSGFLLVLNLDIVVSTADRYAQTLGADEAFSGLVIALTPLFQGLIGIPLNYWMLQSGTSVKTLLILMASGSVAGNIVYALAGLMRSRYAILFARTLIGICQCQLGGPIYIAKAVGVKKRTKVMFVFSAVATFALTAAPLLSALLETFVTELRIENLVLDADTIPGWFMALTYYLFLLKVVFFFENPEKELLPDVSPSAEESQESMWTTGFFLCLSAGFVSTMTNSVAIVYFVKLAQHTWGWSVPDTALVLAALMAIVCFLSLVSSRLAKLVEDRRGLQLSTISAAGCSVLTFQFTPVWSVAAMGLTLAGLLFLLSSSSVVKNYAYALAPKIVPPQFKDRAGTLNMLALTFGRGVGAQVGVLLTSHTFAAFLLGTYLLLFACISVFGFGMRQHAKAT